MRDGQLKVAQLVFEVPEGKQPSSVTVQRKSVISFGVPLSEDDGTFATGAGTDVPARFTAAPGSTRVQVELQEPIVLKCAEVLEIAIEF